MRRIDQKGFGVDVDAELLDKFTDQYVSRGFKKYRTLEGALRLWINLPNEIQAILISDPDYDSSLLAEFLGRRLREALSKALAPEVQSKKTQEALDSKVS